MPQLAPNAVSFHEARLDNGLTVIAELNPNVFSVAVGFYVRTGSRDETVAVSGVSHFLEHMAFKGNERYTADDVNRRFEELGADNNASTTQEVTNFYASVLPEYLGETMDLLSEVMRPSLRQDDFDVEKQVILEEIKMYEDEPGWVVYDWLMEEHFAGHPLAQSVLGTTESITALSAEQMRRYFDEHYRAGNIVLAVAGNTRWDAVLDLAKKHCEHWPGGTTPRDTTECRPKGGELILTRESSFAQYVLSMAAAPPADHRMAYAAQLLSVVVGDGVSSRLFWDIVDPGHAETAQLGYYDFDGSGAWMTYLCGDPAETAANRERIRRIFAEVNEQGVTETELAQAKSKFAARIVLAGERPRGRRSALGENWLYRGCYRSVEDDLRTIAAITQSEIRELLDTYPLAETTTAAIGPLSKLD